MAHLLPELPLDASCFGPEIDNGLTKPARSLLWVSGLHHKYDDESRRSSRPKTRRWHHRIRHRTYGPDQLVANYNLLKFRGIGNELSWGKDYYEKVTSKSIREFKLGEEKMAGRESVPWPKEVWEAIDRHVHDEVMRTRVGAKFLPHRKVDPKTTSIPSDIISFPILPGETTQTLVIDQGATIRLNEIWTEFALTTQQVHETAEADDLADTAAVTLATRAANYLAQAQDLVIFQGVNAYGTPFFNKFVHYLPNQFPSDTGLLSYPISSESPAQSPSTSVPLTGPDPNQVLQIQPVSVTSPVMNEGPGVIYGTSTFAAVALGCSVLQQNGHYGRYALVLHTIPYADLYAPVIGLVITADRITPLVDAGLYGTGTLPANVPASVTQTRTGATYTGMLVALDGDSMDLVVGLQASATFMQQDSSGNWRFQILERFALRLKDSTAVIRLEFQ